MSRFRIAIVFAILLLGSDVLQGQEQAAASAMSQHATHKAQGFGDYALGKINPKNTDYGAAFDAARGAFVTHTLDDLYFWSNVVTLVLLSVLTTVFLFHL